MLPFLGEFLAQLMCLTCCLLVCFQIERRLSWLFLCSYWSIWVWDESGLSGHYWLI